MNLRDLVAQNSKNGKADGIAVTASKLGLGYWTVRSWLKGKRTPGKSASALLKANGITIK